ncbi:integrase core domain protein [Ancylostoma duodenale]|uniref:Integrase core domain protein n=1 Tax=Ancylostoma duodenale TaxID=51022 RepID=A0A0C2HCR6_9BILA|nr:integrase core domain protein [Ancylostoma duodenale]
MRRLENQYAKLHSNPKGWKEYSQTFEQQLKSGIIEDVTDKLPTGPIVYYIPHQAVYKDDSNTTKLRIVFDASTHRRNVPSLNDCVHQEPTMLPDLGGTLLRARLNPYLMTADVEKAFHQIRLQEDQRDATRFLWLKDTTKPPTKDNIRTLRFTRIPFGVDASPFLLNMSIKYALERDRANRLREEILANTYVDNVLIGAKSSDKCIRKQLQCKETFSRMGMNLSEFMTNNNKVTRAIPVKDSMAQKAHTVKLLGVRWNPQTDAVHIAVRMGSTAATTKRTALKAFASTFDPLGLLTPLFVKLKIFIQDLWQIGLSWDDTLDESSVKKWASLVQELIHLVGKVPRFVGATPDTSNDLVIFSDASKRAYAAVAYLICKPSHSKPTSHLIMSKSKLAPLEATTVPRMELLACYLTAKLARFLRSELSLNIYSINFLSDSQIALYWIHSKRPLKSFVESRVKYIRNVIETFNLSKIQSKFHYVTTEANPADCASRGLTTNEIENHMWWSGPQFICDPPSKWPNTSLDFTAKEPSIKEAVEEFKSTTSSVSMQPYESFIPFRRISFYPKLVHVVAFTLKFIANLKRLVEKRCSTFRTDPYSILNTTTFSKQITSDDFATAELLILREHYREGEAQLQSRSVQKLNVERDRDGVYRVNSRMAQAQSDESAKNPILLLPAHPLTKVVVLFYHTKLFHAGSPHLLFALRNKYCISRIRCIVNSAIARCIACKRHQGCHYFYPDRPDLPMERVSRSSPFQHVGLDYFGPFLINSDQGSTRKAWVCLFTCMATRALHLEMVADNTTAQSSLAFRRFTACRGTPESVLSDNAPTFKLGREILVNELTKIDQDAEVRVFAADNGLKWSFITPLSPWKGGFYERLVGSVKTPLKKAVGRRTIDLWTFETLLFETEATLNTRPLTPTTTNSSGETYVLRPIDLINPSFRLGSLNGIKESRRTYSELPESDSHEFIESYYGTLHSVMDSFWTVWHREYLHALSE